LDKLISTTLCIDFQCRVEIQQILLGLQAIYSDKKVRDRVFSILNEIIPNTVDSNNGRPGMDLWKTMAWIDVRMVFALNDQCSIPF
jgi:hypothetical protein